MEKLYRLAIIGIFTWHDNVAHISKKGTFSPYQTSCFLLNLIFSPYNRRNVRAEMGNLSVCLNQQSLIML